MEKKLGHVEGEFDRKNMREELHRLIDMQFDAVQAEGFQVDGAIVILPTLGKHDGEDAEGLAVVQLGVTAHDIMKACRNVSVHVLGEALAQRCGGNCAGHDKDKGAPQDGEAPKE